MLHLIANSMEYKHTVKYMSIKEEYYDIEYMYQYPKMENV